MNISHMKAAKRKPNRKNSLIICLLLACLAICLVGCGPGGRNSKTADMKTWEDMNDPDITVGAINGGVNGFIVQEKLPKVQVTYYNSYVDLATAVESNKIDAITEDSCTLIYHNNQTGNKLRVLDGFLKSFQFGYTFGKTDKGRALCSEVNEYIEKIRDNGTLKEIDRNWMDADGAREMGVDYTRLPAKKGVLKMATTATSPPFSYVVDGTLVGYDLDIIARFCQEYGYGLEPVSMSFDGLMPAVASGKCDIGGSQISITEERKESVEFSAPYYDAGTVVAVYNPQDGGGGFFDTIKESFVKSFLRESRYRLFLNGILTTLMITVLSIIFGTALGFLVYMCCRHGSRIANILTAICTDIIQGLPIVVILLILYYLIFAGAPVSGAFVSVVAFTLLFGSGVYAMLCNGVSAIDKGQTEAAYALGFSDLDTFFKVVLPQAMKYILPQYKSELVSLIKATAIVGYIAVEDLTRTGDIVRSLTYDAFFPLIAIAIIYFLMARIMIFLVSRLERKIDPKRRKREDILKGLQTDR